MRYLAVHDLGMCAPLKKRAVLDLGKNCVTHRGMYIDPASKRALREERQAVRRHSTDDKGLRDDSNIPDSGGCVFLWIYGFAGKKVQLKVVTGRRRVSERGRQT